MHLRFSPKIRLLGRPPNPPARAALLPCQTLHLWSSYAPLRALNTGRLDRLERSMLTASGRTRRRPVRGDEKDRRWRLFYGVWGQVPNKRVAGVCTLMPCLPRLFSVVLGFPPRMKIAPA